MYKFKLSLLLLLLLSSHLEAVQTRWLLITGCGRSGTTYISDVMQKCGVNLPHEDVGIAGTVSWFSTYRGLSLTHHLAPDVKFVHTFHQVRHPLSTISSVYWSFDQGSWNFIESNIKYIHPRDSLLEKSSKYWYYWNLKAESISEWTYRVESIGEVWPEFCRRLSMNFNPKVLGEVPRDTNTWNMVKHKFTWKELQEQIDPDLFDDIQALALKYGYSTTD